MFFGFSRREKRKNTFPIEREANYSACEWVRRWDKRLDGSGEFSGCDELCNEVRKETGCVSDTEDSKIAFEEHALYESDVPVTGMLSDADIVEMAVNDAHDDADEEEPREVPTTTETRNVLRLLRNKSFELRLLLERVMDTLRVAFPDDITSTQGPANGPVTTTSRWLKKCSLPPHHLGTTSVTSAILGPVGFGNGVK
ncbi:hypothetical protein HPB50_027254 [Hyalomma asiaticum]|uniref:Uncharacterized protein n=1 Tax=Hyalomma asiaticum TaxID=266040 RepID=A0ACB7TV58_HYAAI|nr:hypothetical protein HPB50_027254 [Hyalomma asiaticum]